MSGNVKVGNRKGLLGRWQHLEYVVGFNLDRRLLDVLHCITCVPGAIGAFRRQALDAAGGMSTDTLAEDTDVTVGILRVGWLPTLNAVPPGRSGYGGRSVLGNREKDDRIVQSGERVRGVGTMSRSPPEPSQPASPAAIRTRPCSTWTVASPGFACSSRRWPFASAMTVCRNVCSWPPYTVWDARPLEAALASSSCLRARAVSEDFCMGSPSQRVWR